MSTHIHSQPLDTDSVNQAMPLEVEATPGSASFFHLLTSQTPWWVVSTLLHVLLVALVGLATLTVEMPEVAIIQIEPIPPIHDSRHEEQKYDTKATASILAPSDPHKEINNVFTMPEFKGELSEHFESFDPDVVRDKVGAYGDPRSVAMFVRVQKELDGTGSKGDNFQTGTILEEALGFGGEQSTFRGKGTGHGLNEGPGHTPFGRPDQAGKNWRFKKYNPAEVGRMKEWNDASNHALQWLAYHQEADGHWDVKKYGAAHRNDTAITGLALLAFLGAGHTEKIGEHKDSVQRAVKWLIAHQTENGLIRCAADDSATHRSGGYPMAIATLALCEATGMANIDVTRNAAQKAIDYCVNIHQAGDGSDKRGWRYSAKMEGDTSVTGWFIMALKTARVSGLKVPHDAFDGAIRFIESVEVKEAGAGNGYAPASHFKYMPNADHPASAHRLTAIATLARQFLGWSKDDLQASVEWFIEKGGLPAYGGNGEKVDLYYWYYGSMAAFQQDIGLFQKWGHALLDSLLPTQCKDGDDAGSWNPSGDYSGEWGRVGQTALSALCLEVWYRNPRVFEKK